MDWKEALDDLGSNGVYDSQEEADAAWSWAHQRRQVIVDHIAKLENPQPQDIDYDKEREKLRTYSVPMLVKEVINWMKEREISAGAARLLQAELDQVRAENERLVKERDVHQERFQTVVSCYDSCQERYDKLRARIEGSPKVWMPYRWEEDMSCGGNTTARTKKCDPDSKEYYVVPVGEEATKC